jgi:hypothetical protein
MESVQVPINRKMDKENVVYVHNRVLLNIKRKEIVSFVEKCIELGTIMLSEKKQCHKTSISCFLSFEEAIGKQNQTKQNKKPRS